MRATAEQEALALSWIARLPLCGERELAALLGIDVRDAGALVHRLTQGSWVGTVEPGSPELELRRLAFVREEAAPALADAFGIAANELAAGLPVRLRDTIERLARVEITAGVNGFLSGIAAAVRRDRLGELVHARSLPLAVPAARRWWLPGANGYGCLRAGSLWAPFLVAWDRTSAPDVHRRRRVAAWSTIRAKANPGSAAALPLLLVCPSLRQVHVWETAVAVHHARGLPLPELWLTTRKELHAPGSDGAVWRRPGRDRAVPLVEALSWGATPAIRAFAVPRSLDIRVPRVTRSPLRNWVDQQWPAEGPRPVWQRVGALTVSTSPQEKMLIEWVARHPVLSARELTQLLNESRPVVERRLEALERRGAICGADEDKADDTTSGSEKRYMAAAIAVRFLALRAGGLRNGGTKGNRRTVS